MSTRYVVIVRSPEDALRVFGTYRNREHAESFAEKINAKIERREDEDFKAWQARPYNERDLAPDGYGRAGVLVIHYHYPRHRRGSLLRLFRGNPNPQVET